MPVVTVCSSPNGLPIAMTGAPTSSVDESPRGITGGRDRQRANAPERGGGGRREAEAWDERDHHEQQQGGRGPCPPAIPKVCDHGFTPPVFGNYPRHRA